MNDIQREAFIEGEYRKQLLCRLADKALSRLSDSQIVEMCPEDYSSEITDDHRLYIWNSAYDEFEKLSDKDLIFREELYFNNNNRDLPATVINQLLFTATRK